MTPLKFPTMLRKMWSGQEVQDWIEANWPQQDVHVRVQSSESAPGYEFPRADPVKAPGWVIDPSFVSAIQEVIQSDELMTQFKPDIEQIETVLIALERMQKQPF